MALKLAMHNWMRPEPIETTIKRLARFGAPEALAFVRRTDFEPSRILPMAQMQRE